MYIMGCLCYVDLYTYEVPFFLSLYALSYLHTTIPAHSFCGYLIGTASPSLYH